MIVRSLFALLAFGLLSMTAAAQKPGPSAFRYQAQLEKAVADPRRSSANTARDPHRHPVETLAFFGVEPDDTIVEIWPSNGWYTEILAPYVQAGGGKLIGAALNEQLNGLNNLKAAQPELHGPVEIANFPAFDATARRVPDGSADVVLTFRNVHNWKMGARREDGQDYSAEAFRQMYAMLKPGGILGVVEHRLPESASDERELNSGYIKMSTVRRLAKEAGFREVAASEINANPKDTTDWPKGVWTLPPALRLGEVDRDKYLAVGESDRMTLKFVKPR